MSMECMRTNVAHTVILTRMHTDHTQGISLMHAWLYLYMKMRYERAEPDLGVYVVDVQILAICWRCYM